MKWAPKQKCQLSKVKELWWPCGLACAQKKKLWALGPFWPSPQEHLSLFFQLQPQAKTPSSPSPIPHPKPASSLAVQNLQEPRHSLLFLNTKSAPHRTPKTKIVISTFSSPKAEQGRIFSEGLGLCPWRLSTTKKSFPVKLAFWLFYQFETKD